ncbi:sugar phosphate nucleotidyltransferase [Desmospora profundinema]|uniref:Glucose-1-phosphate thymidylyltransferase n=1 Tax=Desmospora profundinema TaxID=1571184 RepID=A0ABU1IHP9_9BACL|nr:sugar phosphate nucleotidyltransferase [Desmospora profundinema]MDR6224299.1 glucose-1-phosphate thymidylyltransferase [Desmospora profundinema]
MKGVVLAGGTGSRLFPLTKVTNKHLLPVGQYPMILHPVGKMTQCGIQDILVVTGSEHIGDVVRLLGSGKEYGVRFTYKVQDRPGGIAEALSLAREYAEGEHLLVMLGDNVFEDNLAPYVKAFNRQGSGAKLLLKRVKNPERFGVAEVKEERIIRIEEKPSRPKSNLAVTGIYLYDERVFSYIEELEPSARGELEITDVNNCYIRDSILTFDVLEGWWTDAGTHPSLLRAHQLASPVRLPFFQEKRGDIK